MASADDVIATLQAAKRKLTEGKNKGLQGATLLGHARNSVSHALGRAGVGSPLLAEIAAKERALVEQLMRTDALVQRVDQAIAQARNAAGGGGATPGGGPIAGPARSGDGAAPPATGEPADPGGGQPGQV
jgi:hypothetical protein